MSSSQLVGSGRPVLVVGAGFSGLVAAHYLKRAGFAVEVREMRADVGGLINTRTTEWGLVETAANGILNSKPVEELFDFAGVELIPTLRSARARYIFRGPRNKKNSSTPNHLTREGNPLRWPLSLLESFRVAYFFLRFFFCRSSLRPIAGETIRSWGTRVFSETVSRYTLETAFQGIYAGDPSRMSATLLLSSLFEDRATARRNRPRFRGTVSARGGMGELMTGLRRSLEKQGVRFCFNSPVTMGELQSYGAPIVIATRADQASHLLEHVDPLRASALASIEFLPLITTTVFLKPDSRQLRGFGCLFPPEEAPVLGVLMNNWIFPDRAQNSVSETWIMGGALFKGGRERIQTISDIEVLELIHAQRKLLNNSDDEIVSSVVTRWPNALPHFTIDLEKQVPLLRTPQKNIWLLGNYTGAVGLGKIVDQAFFLAEQILQQGTWSK